MKPKTFTSADLGCWIDGAFGHAHRRQKLAEMVEAFCPAYKPGEGLSLAQELREEASDDMSEEDDAIELLQAHTDDGLVWVSDCGDLCLCKESELE